MKITKCCMQLNDPELARSYLGQGKHSIQPGYCFCSRGGHTKVYGQQPVSVGDRPSLSLATGIGWSRARVIALLFSSLLIARARVICRNKQRKLSCHIYMCCAATHSRVFKKPMFQFVMTADIGLLLYQEFMIII